MVYLSIVQFHLQSTCEFVCSSVWLLWWGKYLGGCEFRITSPPDMLRLRLSRFSKYARTAWFLMCWLPLSTLEPQYNELGYKKIGDITNYLQIPSVTSTSLHVTWYHEVPYIYWTYREFLSTLIYWASTVVMLFWGTVPMQLIVWLPVIEYETSEIILIFVPKGTFSMLECF